MSGGSGRCPKRNRRRLIDKERNARTLAIAAELPLFTLLVKGMPTLKRRLATRSSQSLYGGIMNRQQWKNCKPCVDRRDSGLTILEVLCVLVILSILLSMFFPVIAKVRRRADERIYHALMQQNRLYYETRDKLRDFYRAKTNYTALTAEELHQVGVFDANIVRWMRLGLIRFYPFASTAPAGKRVMDFYSHTGSNGVSVWTALSKSNIIVQAEESE